MGLIFKDANEKPLDAKGARLRATLLSVPFALLGIFALVLLLHDGLLGGLSHQKVMGLLSAVVACGGFIALIFGITAKKQDLLAPAKAAPASPWLARKEWAGGRIASSARKAVVLLWIFVAFWCVGSALICLMVVPVQLQQGNRLALVALVFPVIGLAIIWFALSTSRAWRRFNRSLFCMGSFPAPAGGTLTGAIEVPAPLRPEHGWHLRLSCVRRTVTGASNNRQASDQVLWEDERWLRSDLPSAAAGATRIPVFFKLPDGLPESGTATGDGIHWQLEASAKLRGPSFNALFDVPVFKLPETPAAGEDPTLACQLSLDEVQQQIRSLVQVKELAAGGKAFEFPAARNPGFASGASVICLIWTVIIGLLWWKHAPAPLLLILTTVDALMVAYVFDLWFRRSRVVVNSQGGSVERAWFGFRKEEQIRAKDIRNIASDVGATAGHAVYHDLRAYTRDGKDVLLAKNLNNQPEAHWLARQMTVALKAVPKVEPTAEAKAAPKAEAKPAEPKE
jgi:hypothetical protein